MIDLELTVAEHALLMATLTDSHSMRIKVRVHDKDEKVLDEISDSLMLLGGAVQVDATADVSRSLSLTLLDPDFKLKFDAQSPAKGALYADRFISVLYEVYVPTLEWVSIPVFWGPMSKFNRDNAEVTIEAQGKESLALAPHFATYAYRIPRHTTLDNAIKQVMNRVGETRYNIPELSKKLSKSRHVLPTSQPWGIVVGGEEDANGKPIPGLLGLAANPMEAFYDGRGRLHVRRANRSSVMTFMEGVHLADVPKLDYDIAEFRNHVVVTGGDPKGKKKVVRGSASLDANHPLSPYSLRRNGHNRYMTEFVDATNLKTHAECVERAKRILAQKSSEGLNVSFDSLPIPMLEENDPITVVTEDYTVTFPAKQFTIPLTSDSLMSVGANKRVRLKKRSAWS